MVHDVAISLERVQGAVSVGVSPAMGRRLRMDTRLSDDILSGVVYAFSSWAYGHRLKEDEIKVPLTWWDALKAATRSRWPWTGRFLRVRQTVYHLTAWALLPEFDVDIPSPYDGMGTVVPHLEKQAEIVSEDLETEWA